MTKLIHVINKSTLYCLVLFYTTQGVRTLLKSLALGKDDIEAIMDEIGDNRHIDISKIFLNY